MLSYIQKERNAVQYYLVGTYSIVQLSVLVNNKCTEGGCFVESCKFTPFGLCVKTELLKRGKSQKWLESEIRTATGMFVDDGYLYKIFTGQRTASKIVQAICEILGISDTPTS